MLCILTSARARGEEEEEEGEGGGKGEREEGGRGGGGGGGGGVGREEGRERTVNQACLVYWCCPVGLYEPSRIE